MTIAVVTTTAMIAVSASSAAFTTCRTAGADHRSCEIGSLPYRRLHRPIGLRVTAYGDEAGHLFLSSRTSPFSIRPG